MPPYPQFWNNAKSSQIISDQVGSVAAGNTFAGGNFYLFNDKGALLGGSTLSGAVLIAEYYDGSSWLRYGHPIVDDAWIEVSITGTVDNTGGGIGAQTTAYTKLGAGRSLAVTAIPVNCGRQIAVQVVAPVGTSEGTPRWRIAVLYDETLDPVVLQSTGDSRYVNVSGDTMTGDLGIGGAPARTLHVRPSGTNTRALFTNDTTGHNTSDGLLLSISGLDGNLWNNEAGNLLFGTNNTERLRIDSTGNVGFGGSSSFGGGAKVVFIANAGTNPSSNPTGGHIVYVDAGALKGRGSSGTVTTIAPAEPHCPVCGSDVGLIEAVNHDDRYFSICIPCLVDDLNLGGKPYVVTDDAPSRPKKRTGQELADALRAAKDRAKAAREAAKHDPTVVDAPFDVPGARDDEVQ